MAKFLNVLMEERDEKEAVGFFGNWAKYHEENEKKGYDWRYENSIISGKKSIEIDGDYSQWRTNFVLCNHRELIFHVNEMNINYNVTNKMHYDYLFYSVRKKKRWSQPETKEEKKEREKQQELHNLISGYYKYNTLRAKEALRILTAEQIEIIRTRTYKGGVK